MGIQRTPSQWLPLLLKRARDRRGWTAEDLAEAVAAHGGTLTPNAIAKIETNRRNVSVDEWIVLAAAVNVPPALLLVPLGVDELVHMTDKAVIHPHLAYEWMAGEECLTNTDGYVIDRGAWMSGAQPASAFSRLRRTQRDVDSARSTLTSAKYVGDEDRLTEARSLYVDALRAHHRAVEILITGGLRAPELDPNIINDMHTVGLDIDHLPVYDPEDH